MAASVHPITWGIAMLAAGGASEATLQRYRDEERELMRKGNPDPEPEPERTPPERPSSTDRALSKSLEQMLRTQKRIRHRCDDEGSFRHCESEPDG